MRFFLRLFFAAFTGSFGTFAVAHGAQTESWRWSVFGILLWCVGFAFFCMPRIRIRPDWAWVVIIRDLTRRFR